MARAKFFLWERTALGAGVKASRIDIITVLPELLKSPFEHSIMKRAQAKGLLEVYTHNLRKWAINNQGQIDDYQYGGGAGMVMMCEHFYSLLKS